MSFFKFDQDFWRRFRLYGFGLILGIILVNVITKGKACQSPGTLKMGELNAQVMHCSPKITCQLASLHLQTSDLKLLMKNASVSFTKSDVRGGPFPVYFVKGDLADGSSLSLQVMDKADTTLFVQILDKNFGNQCP